MVSRRRVVCDSSSSSEEEFTLPPTSPVPSHLSGVRVHTDYVGRRVRVPESYFNMEGNSFFEGTVNKWSTHRNSKRENYMDITFTMIRGTSTT